MISRSHLAEFAGVKRHQNSSLADGDAEADALVIVEEEENRSMMQVLQLSLQGSARQTARMATTSQLKEGDSALEQESREEAKQASAGAGALDGKGASAMDAGSSDLAANIDALTWAVAAVEKRAVSFKATSDLPSSRLP